MYTCERFQVNTHTNRRLTCTNPNECCFYDFVEFEKNIAFLLFYVNMFLLDVGEILISFSFKYEVYMLDEI